MCLQEGVRFQGVEGLALGKVRGEVWRFKGYCSSTSWKHICVKEVSGK